MEPEDYYASITDVRALIDFPKLDDADIQALIEQNAGEFNTVLLMKGASVPVTAPADFVNTLRKGVAYGVAASIQARGVRGSSAATRESGITMYADEYHRILEWLKSLTTENLIRLGGLPGTTPSLVGLQMGLRLAKNVSVENRTSYLNRYPFTLIKSGES